jgi:hypothetical protein
MKTFFPKPPMPEEPEGSEEDGGRGRGSRGGRRAEATARARPYPSIPFDHSNEADRIAKPHKA